MTTLSSLIQTIAADASSDSSTSGYYLPFVILGQPMSLDPLAVGDLPSDLLHSGAITPCGHAGSLQFFDVVVVGLSNVVLGTPSVNGGDVTLPLSFGGAAMPPGFSVPSALQLSASFSSDCLCPGCDTPIGGSVTMTFGTSASPASMTAELSVSPLGSGGTVLSNSAVTLTSLALASSTAISVNFVVTSPADRATQLSELLNCLFNDTAGTSTLLATMNRALASPVLSTIVGGALTTALPSLADTPLLAALLSIVYQAASNPSSSVYLPSALMASTNPVLDPFTAGGPFDLGNMNAVNPAGGSIICAAFSNENLYINTPGTPLDLSVDNVVVTGLSNIIAAPPLVIAPAGAQTNDVYGVAALGTLAGWSTQLSVSGDFTMTVSCCQSTNGTTCSATPVTNVGTGTFSGTIASASISAAVTVGTNTSDELTATVDQLFLHIDPNVVNPENVVWTITIDDVSEQYWITQAQQDFDSSIGTAAIFAQVESEMNSPSILQALSTILTNTIQSASAAVAR